MLSAAQFLMVLDQAVMNVSISQLVEDFETSVTTIQGVITFYALTMAALMITGGKLGDIWGRRRAFTIGLIVYGFGSAVTAISQTVGVLLFGWSILEGIGAALVLPALVALIAATYRGADRSIAYGVIGGVAGAGIAVGPILGGWVTTNFSWRYVFVGEVILAILIVLAVGWIADTPQAERVPKVDWLGVLLSASGLGLFVLGILRASEWGWVTDNGNSPIAPLGLSFALVLAATGALLLAWFMRWSERREKLGLDPLFRLRLLQNASLRVSLQMFLSQSLILMGVFFSVPLYLQVVQGLNALDTGIRMLPVSVTMFIMSFVGARLSSTYPPRQIVRAGLWILLVAVLVLAGTIEPVLAGPGFGLSMALLGIGMGLLASQLGALAQASVDSTDRSEAGGLQYTAQQLGSSIGTAMVGAIVISALASAFVSQISTDPRVPADLSETVSVRLSGSIEFISVDDLEPALAATSLTSDEVDALIEAYENGQLTALRLGLSAAALLVVITLFLARRVPDVSLEELAARSKASAA